MNLKFIYFKLFSNKAICKQRDANKNQIKIKYRKMLACCEFAVQLFPE